MQFPEQSGVVALPAGGVGSPNKQSAVPGQSESSLPGHAAPPATWEQLDPHFHSSAVAGIPPEQGLLPERREECSPATLIATRRKTPLARLTSNRQKYSTHIRRRAPTRPGFSQSIVMPTTRLVRSQ